MEGSRNNDVLQKKRIVDYHVTVEPDCGRSIPLDRNMFNLKDFLYIKKDLKKYSSCCDRALYSVGLASLAVLILYCRMNISFLDSC